MSLPFLFEQAMRALMTIVAPCELAQHLCVMRCTMTILALWHNSMFVGMAEDALECCMLGCTSLKTGSDVFVACAAITVFNVGAVGKCQGLMDLVTFDAGLEFLVFRCVVHGN